MQAEWVGKQMASGGEWDVSLGHKCKMRTLGSTRRQGWYQVVKTYVTLLGNWTASVGLVQVGWNEGS